MANIGFKHSCNIGDVIASLAGIKTYCDDSGDKAIYYQKLNVEGNYFQNAQHPTQENGKQVMCNQKMFDALYPLIKAQDYIADFKVYDGQDYVVNLDVIRNETFVNMPYGAIQSWYAFAFPDLYADISKEWITVPTNEAIEKEFKGKILINFTCRYRNNFIDYSFLKKYEDRVVFIGTETEKKDFCELWGLNIPYAKVNDFLELAQVIKASDFLLSNQSFCWNLATALGSPRILELCSYAPNCIPFIGKDNYGFYNQKGLEFYFQKLLK